MKMSSRQHAHSATKVGSISSKELMFCSPVFAHSYSKTLGFLSLKSNSVIKQNKVMKVKKYTQASEHFRAQLQL